MLQHKYMFVMLGLPGSGKTTFAIKLGEHLNSPVLIADKLRLEWIEVPQWDAPEHGFVYGKLNDITIKNLQAGKSVIYDSNHNKRKTRAAKYKLAREQGARAVLLWVDVPPGEQDKRARQRVQSGGSSVLPNDKLKKTFQEILAVMRYQFQPPGPDEPVIRIDGTAPFDRQLQQFEQGLQAVEAKVKDDGRKSTVSKSKDST